MSMAGIDFCEVVTLVNDPEPRVGNSGGSWCTFRVAYNPREKDREGKYQDGAATYLGAKAFGTFSEKIVATFHKGDRALIKGKVTTQRYTDNHGAERESLVLAIDEIGACPRFADVQVTRSQKREGGSGASGGSGMGEWSSPPQNGAQGGGQRMDDYYGSSGFGSPDDEQPF